MKALQRNLVSFLLVGSFPIYADWICTEASSQRQGDSILACGIGQASDEQTARNYARESALNEFNVLCDASANCHPYETQLEPGRTECSKTGEKFVCHRGLKFHVTDKRKSSVLVNVEDTKIELERERNTLKALEEQYARLQSLQSLKEQAEAQKEQIKKLEKKMGAVEGKAIQLEQKVSDSALSNHDYKYTHDLFRNSFKLAATYNSLRLANDGELFLGFSLSYEYRPFQFLGVSARYGFGADLAPGRVMSPGDLAVTGTPNTSLTQIGRTTYNDLALGVNLYTGLGGLYVKGEIGTFLGTQTSYQIDFSPIGTATSTTKTSVNFSKPYWGAGLGWDSREDKKGWGGFVEVGAKAPLSGGGSPGIAISVGGNWGF